MPTSSVAAPSSSASAIPDVTVLFGRAVNIIRATNRPTYSRAIMLEADGTTRGGFATKSAAGIVRWRFVFDNQPSSSRFKSATLVYGPAPTRFGKVQGNRSVFVEDLRIPRAPRMTLRQAVARLQQAGYRSAFFNVTLRNPLGPKRTNPLYIFGFAGNSYVAVNTVTKKVSRLSALQLRK